MTTALRWRAVSAELAAPAPRVWSLLVDTETWPLWGPSITAVDHDGRIISEGSRGQVRTKPGLWVPFVVTELVEGVRWEWRVGGVQATSHEVESLDPERCSVTFTVPRWAPGYTAVCSVALRRLARLSAP